MSEAMTNREIEDVLTSIRRLVAQEGSRPAGGEGGKLLLTPAQRVEATSQDAETADSTDPTVDLSLPAPDFHRLEATIAELEAAVSSTEGAWEADSNEAAPRPSNVTELYGKLSFAHRPRDEALAKDDAAAKTEASTKIAESAASDVETAAPEPLVLVAPVVAAPDSALPATAAPVDIAAEDDADGPVEAVIDEATLRAVVALLVREELHGQLGERITQQVRKLVRAEITKVLDERKFL